MDSDEDTARPPSAFALAWRQTLRDFRAGELRLLLVAVTLAVGALTAVGFFADRLERSLARDARQLLGGDAIVSSDRPTPQAFLDEARARGLQVATTTGFPSMGRAPDDKGGASKLVAVKAVSDGYPLRGRLKLRNTPDAPERDSAGAPDPGTVWVDASLLDALQLKMGDTLLLGDAALKIARIVAIEPDRGAGFMSFAPRVMVGHGDLAATGLVQPASRVSYRLAVASPASRDAEVSAFVRWAEEQIGKQALRGVRVESMESGRPEMKQTLDRAKKFLNLVALLAALLAAVAVAIASREFAERHLNDCAMLRVLGQPQRSIAGAYALEFGAVGLIASVAGVLLGLLVHNVFVWLLAALLAAVAVAIASREFAERHLNDCAMLRVLGQPQRSIAGAYALEFGAVGLIASVAGVLLGLLVHNVFVWLLAGLVQADLPPVGVWPALFGIGVGLTLLIGFGLPPVLQLASVPPLRVIRRDVGGLKPASLLVLGAGAVGFAALLLAVSSDLKLGLIAVGGFAAAVAVFALLAWCAVLVLKRAVPEANAPRWLVLATRQIAARPAFAVLQVSSLSVGLLALVLLVLLRTDLVSSWRKATPPDAPNRFVINIQPEQSEAFRKVLDGAGVQRYDWYPMIRGRLVAVNGKATTPETFGAERAKRLIEREFNLSHTAQLPSHNTVTSGQWKEDETGAASVEDGLAQELGLKLGDTMRFDVGGAMHEARITSLRKVDWGSMRVNFFVIFPQAQMPGLPATVITAFRAPAVAGFDNTLTRDFPNITTVDVSAQIDQVQRVLGQVIRAVEFLFAFTLATGLVVLFAAVTATREARAKEFAVMRALGASQVLLGRVQRAELAGVGALAGVLASVAAMVVGWALARYAFEFQWTASWWVPLAGGVAGALLALAAGWWGLRDVLRRPVIETLRRATSE